MSTNRRVVWSEGLFLRPHHFQQQERHFTRAVDLRCGAVRGNSWGFSELEIEADLLMIGQLSLRRARGVFPDGTPFSMPDDDPLPAPLAVPDSARGQAVFLALPLHRAGLVETERTPPPDSLARFSADSITVRDSVAGFDGEAALEVGTLRSRLVLASQPSEGYARIPLAQIVERRPDARVVLDDQFMPTALTCRAAVALQSFLTELQGLIKQRGDMLANRAVATGRAASAEISDFLMLQTVNRYEPVITHIARAGHVHPEDAYLRLVELAGDLATLILDTRRVPSFPLYRHDQLQASFDPVIRTLREEFGALVNTKAVEIPLTFKRGAYVGQVPDLSLFEQAMFVLVARADVPAETLRRNVPSHVKMSEKDSLGTIVNNALPGIPLQALAAAPRQIPYVTNSVYFELLQGGDLWNGLRRTGQLALFVHDRDRAYPNLALELWAVRT